MYELNELVRWIRFSQTRLDDKLFDDIWLLQNLYKVWHRKKERPRDI